MGTILDAIGEPPADFAAGAAILGITLNDLLVALGLEIPAE